MRVISNRGAKDLLIVDNYLYSYGFQLLNGIPIIPFYNDPLDNELPKLAKFLLRLCEVEDSRAAVEAFFFVSLLKKYYKKPELLTEMMIKARAKS